MRQRGGNRSDARRDGRRDDDGFETIARELIDNDEIRTQVAATSVDRLFANVDVEAALAERLPEQQQGLAPVLAGLARSGADRAAEAALERPRVQTLWVETTTGTQRQLVRLLDDETEFIQVEGGTVVLDLRPLMLEIGEQVVVIGRLAQRLPSSAYSSSRSTATARFPRASTRCEWSSPSLGKGGEVTLYLDGAQVGNGRVDGTVPMIFSADETTDIGSDSATPVSDDYGPKDSEFTGRVRWVQLDIDAAAEDSDHLITPEERLRIAMARQ